MYLNEDLHNKLVEDFKLIIGYLKENVASKIIKPCRFKLDHLNIIIFPIKKNDKRWLSIEEFSCYFTIKEYNDIFYSESGGECFDLFAGWDGTTDYSDEYLYKIVSNWGGIKERCDVCLNQQKNI